MCACLHAQVYPPAVLRIIRSGPCFASGVKCASGLRSASYRSDESAGDRSAGGSVRSDPQLAELGDRVAAALRESASLQQQCVEQDAGLASLTARLEAVEAPREEGLEARGRSAVGRGRAKGEEGDRRSRSRRDGRRTWENIAWSECGTSPDVTPGYHIIRKKKADASAARTPRVASSEAHR